MITTFKHITIFSALLICGTAAAQTPAQTTDSSNKQTAYNNLITKDKILKSSEDSLSKVIVSLRSKFASSTPQQKEAISKDIISSEESIFSIRSQRSSIESEINDIKGLESLQNDTFSNNNKADNLAKIVYDSKQIYNNPFTQESLPSKDLTSLQTAQKDEIRAAQEATNYTKNYDLLSSLALRYDQTENQQEADSITVAYNRLDSINRYTAQNITELWNSIYDNKSFAYALLMESLGRKDILDKELSIQQKAAAFIVEHEGETLSHDYLTYFAKKRALIEYEIEIATALNMPQAVDSLKNINSTLKADEFRYPPLAIKERLFIDYEPIKFSSKPQYNGNNPIPNGKVYEKGLIYRILVGTFRTRQAATLFRGAYPMYIIKDKNNLLAYYAGGYATIEEANTARKIMLKHGFRRPEVVEWNDGELTNLTRFPRTEVGEYRVEIHSQQSLSDAVLNAIETQAPDCEISRVGSTFIIGKFANPATAKSLVDKITTLEPSTSIEIVKITD